jgi:UDP-glucose 4-epimerase
MESFFDQGDVEISKETEYNSHNTTRLDIEGVKKKLLELEYVRKEVESWKKR